MGIQRLRDAAFHAMPRRIAVASVAGGLAVVAFGVLLFFVRPSSESMPLPRATLDPIPERSDENTPERGVVGRVVTSRGRGVEGAKVTLLPLFDAKGVEALDATTDAQGGFRFDDVEIDPGSPYVAETSYDGTTFASEVLRRPLDDATALALVVAETTKDAGDLVVGAESLAVVGDDAGLQAVHALSVDNDGKRAFVGKLALPLLRGASAIQEGPGLDRRGLELTDDAMISRSPLLPGDHDLTYTYVTQMSKDGITLEREVSLPTKRYELLVAGDLDFEPADGLRRDGQVRLGPPGEQRTYKRFVGRDLEPGEHVAGRIHVASASGSLRVVVPAAAVALALAILALGLLRRRRSSVVAIPEPAPHTS